MVRDDAKYEFRTVRAVRGTEPRTIKKWEQNGWEVTGRTPGKFQTEIAMRRPQPRAPWLRVAIAGGLTLALIAVALVMSVVQGDGADDAPVAVPKASEATPDPEGVESGNSKAVETASTPTEAIAAPASEAEETITIETNDDFAAIASSTDYCGDQIAAFAEEHQRQQLRFEGSLDAIDPHGS